MTDDEDDWSEDDDSDESETVTCPNCKAEVYEDAEQCPSCREWIVSSTHPFAGRPWWFIAAGVLGIVATIAVLSMLAF